jgi:hypothetical protein
MNNISKILLSSLFMSSLGLASCSDDFLDINNNPNLPTSVSPDLVLASGTGNMIYVLGGQFQIAGNFLAQHWTQNLVSNQYKELDRYNILQTTYDAPFVTLFAGAQQDFQVVINRAKGDSSNYAAIAGIQQAYTYQLLSDAYDRVPFTQALQGGGNVQPAYDEGPVIYDGAVRLINQSVAKINTSSTAVSPGKQDVVFGGDMEKWRRFANTLKLRMFLRQVYVRPKVAEDSIRAMFSKGAQFLGATENAQVAIFTSGKNASPISITEFLGSGITGNVIASSTVIDYLVNTSDPRIDDLFDRPTAGGANAAYVGTPQGLAGTNNAPTPAITARSRPDIVKIIGPTAPVILISGAESMFLQAEAAIRGFTTGDAKSLYNQGIASSFNRLGTPTTRIDKLKSIDKVTGKEVERDTTIRVLDDLLASAPVNFDKAVGVDGPNSKLDRIITQKWVSMSGSQGFEAWSELRRTNYPSFIKPSLSSTLAPGIIANRFPYPATESARNPNTPKVELVQVPVWWDTKPL